MVISSLFMMSGKHNKNPLLGSYCKVSKYLAPDKIFQHYFGCIVSCMRVAGRILLVAKAARLAGLNDSA